MMPADFDLLKKLKKDKGKLKKILPGDKADREPFERDTLSHLRKAMDELKNPFNKG